MFLKAKKRSKKHEMNFHKFSVFKQQMNFHKIFCFQAALLQQNLKHKN